MADIALSPYYGKEEEFLGSEKTPFVWLAMGGVQGRVVQPFEYALNDLCNLLTFTYYPSFFDNVRGKFVRGIKNTSGNAEVIQGVSRPPTGRQRLARGISRVTSRTFDKVSLIPKDRRLPEPDLLFVVELYERVADLKEFSCPKAIYAGDVHVNLDRYFDIAHAEEYDYVFVGEKDYIPIFKERGCKNVYWLPPGTEPRITYGPRLPTKWDVCFVGTVYSGHPREKLLKKLQESFSTCAATGVFLRDMSAILRSSKIVFNRSYGSDLNPRVFDGMSAGSLVLTDRSTNGLLDLFKEDYHLACYGDESEMLQKAKEYLGNDKRREEVATRGQAEVLAKHTYVHRMVDVLDKCLGFDARPLAKRLPAHNLAEFA